MISNFHFIAENFIEFVKLFDLLRCVKKADKL